MEILFCPPNSPKSITNSSLSSLLIKFCSCVADNFMQVRKVKEATWEYKKSYREQMSPIGLYIQLNSPNNFSANRSVVDSNHCT